MNQLEIEEALAEQSVIYISNPGEVNINILKQYYDVVIVSEDQIKITYKL